LALSPQSKGNSHPDLLQISVSLCGPLWFIFLAIISHFGCFLAHAGHFRSFFRLSAEAGGWRPFLENPVLGGRRVNRLTFAFVLELEPGWICFMFIA
jgi:hypothetical protein